MLSPSPIGAATEGKCLERDKKRFGTYVGAQRARSTLKAEGGVGGREREEIGKNCKSTRRSKKAICIPYKIGISIRVRLIEGTRQSCVPRAWAPGGGVLAHEAAQPKRLACDWCDAASFSNLSEFEEHATNYVHWLHPKPAAER